MPELRERLLLPALRNLFRSRRRTAFRAYATLVRNALVNEPELPQPNTPITLRLELLDPNEVPVQDDVVTAGFTRSGQANTSIGTRFTETDEPGIYLSDPVVFPSAGRYRLLLRIRPTARRRRAPS